MMIDTKQLELVIERVYSSHHLHYNPQYLKASDALIGPCIYIKLYKNQKSREFMLSLECDFDSPCASFLVEEGICPDFGNAIISNESATFLKNELSQLGTEYFESKFPEYEKLMGKLLSIIPCRVYFGPSFHESGLYNKYDDYIFIATNRTKFEIVFSTIHEYTHFLLDSIKAQKPQKEMTVIEYLQNENEYICNSVALNVLTEMYPDYISNLYFDVLPIISILSKKQAITNEEKEDTIRNLSIDQNFILMVTKNIHSLSFPTKTSQLINKLCNQITNELSKTSVITDKKTLSYIKQNELVILNEKDNEKLLNLIKNNIAPLLT